MKAIFSASSFLVLFGLGFLTGAYIQKRKLYLAESPRPDLTVAMTRALGLRMVSPETAIIVAKEALKNLYGLPEHDDAWPAPVVDDGGDYWAVGGLRTFISKNEAYRRPAVATVKVSKIDCRVLSVRLMTD